MKATEFTPYSPESPDLQTGDDRDFKSKDKEKPCSLRQGYTGFTLIEVLVAVAILGVGLTVIIELFSGGLRLGRASEEYTQAVNYARTKLEETAIKPVLEEGIEEGSFNDTFRWQVDVKKVNLLPVEDKQDFKPPAQFFQVQIDVIWKSGAKERSTRIESYRTIKPKEDEKKS
jgi:general secretion pathway protein I